jgi:hypothetical protein
VRAAARKIDRRDLLLLIRLPDRVDRPRRSDVAERGLETQRHVGGLIAWDRGELFRGHRGRFAYGGGDVERPLQAGDVGQVGHASARLKAGEEVGEVGAVFDEAARVRRMLAQVLVRGVGEEARVDQATDHREGGFQRLTQRGEGVIAVDAEPRPRSDAIAPNGGNNLPGIAAEDGVADPHLKLKQLGRIGRHGPSPRRRGSPRRAGPRARAGGRPTRSG